MTLKQAKRKLQKLMDAADEMRVEIEEAQKGAGDGEYTQRWQRVMSRLETISQTADGAIANCDGGL